MNEPDFIAALRALPLHGGADGLMDDAATLSISGETLILTHDMIAEGVHYRSDTDPADVAWKLVAVNLSDLAAKGAEPLGVLIGATLIEGAERFVAGLGEILSEYGVPLIGGDTISASPASFGCTAIGRATHVPVPRRGGARPGDGLWVAGSIGGAMLGFEGSGDTAPYLRPRPLLAEGRALAPHAAAMMDISDGLLLDARRMGDASGCAVEIRIEAVPFAPGVAPERRIDAAAWGDDYALLFAAPAGFKPPVPAACIGVFAPGSGLSVTRHGTPVRLPEKLGYSHGA